mgnify:CR=1 FL=1
MAHLLIMESPSKANTVKNYLGSSYKVVASKGHVRDLPKSTLGVDIENNFDAHYINIRGKGELISSLKKEVKNARFPMLSSEVRRLKESEGGMQVMCEVMKKYERLAVREERIDKIKKMIAKGCSKEFILDLDYTEEEYAEAEAEFGREEV